MKNIFILVLALFVSTANADVINAFTAEYKASDWEITENGGSAIFSDNDSILTQISNNDNLVNDTKDPYEAFTDTIFDSAHSDGIISFDWLYNTNDHPASDYFGWLLNGDFNLLSDLDHPTGVGTLTSSAFAVELGDIFGFRTVSTTSTGGSATIEISNFKFTTSEVPEPSSMAFFALVCIFIGLHRRKLAK